MNLHADVLIVTATKVESNAIFEVFQKSSNQKPVALSVGDRMCQNLGNINGTSIFLMQSEMGTSGLGASLQTIEKGIAALSPDAVIMVGIAFGMNAEKQSIGDVLVSQRLMLYELQRVGVDEGIPLLIPRGDRPHASPWLLDRFRSADMYWDDSKFKVRFGLILSGDKLIDNFDFRQQLHGFEPEAIGGEMEGAGLYVACQDAKVDWILIKSICDWADGYKDQNKDEYQQLAAHNAASFVLNILQQAPLKRKDTQGNSVTSALLDRKTDSAQVTILLNREMHEFTPNEQASFIFALSRIVNIAPDQIQILRVLKGSVSVTIEMPDEAAKTLLSLFLQKAFLVQTLQIIKMEVNRPIRIPLRIGVIGYEDWDPNLIRDFYELLSSDLIAVADPKGERLKHAQSRYPQLITQKNYQGFFNLGLDAVIISTPSAKHYTIAKDCLEHNLHVFVEKPRTLNSQQIKELVELADAKGLTLMVGHKIEYDSALIVLKNLIDSGELGEIYYIDIARKNLGVFQGGTNVLWDLAPNEISILLFLLNQNPISVSAQNIPRGLSDDNNLAFIFPNNIPANIHVSWLESLEVRRVTIVGGKKMAVYNEFGNETTIKIYNKGADIVIPKIHFASALLQECQYFIDRILVKAELKNSSISELRVIKTLEAVQRSITNDSVQELIRL